jgi:hypothetical protein
MVRKEEFIYEKKNTITSVLCDDIIEIFETELLNNNCIVCNNMILFDIEKYPLYIRIINILGIELLNLCTKYLSNLDYYFNENFNINYNFKVKKLSYLNNEILYNTNTKVIENTNKLKILNFIYFLNDYDGEYIFFNNYSIKPKKGSILFFPVSIHYSYIEKIKIFETKYIIEGYIYI